MLTQKTLKALSLLRTQQSSYLPISTSCINYNYPFDYDKSDKPEDQPVRKLKKWREDLKVKDNIIPINADNSYFKMFRTKMKFTPWGLKKQWDEYCIKRQIELQQFIPERHKILGPDLALAHFLIFTGGKVRFKGSDKWISLNADKTIDLPNKFDPNYILTEIDASDCVLYYEGLENFLNCPRVKWASFARCQKIDDWCIDRIVSHFPFIEHLDFSDCPGVSERGLEALYKTSMLKTLIVTNHYKSAAFELTCMMLEDVVPGLQIDIRQPKEKAKPLINPIE